MKEINYSALLRDLVDEYFDHRLTRVEYVAQRRGILDRIDQEFNGEEHTSGWHETDTTQPQHYTDAAPPRINALDRQPSESGERDPF